MATVRASSTPYAQAQPSGRPGVVMGGAIFGALRGEQACAGSAAAGGLSHGHGQPLLLMQKGGSNGRRGI